MISHSLILLQPPQPIQRRDQDRDVGIQLNPPATIDEFKNDE